MIFTHILSLSRKVCKSYKKGADTSAVYKLPECLHLNIFWFMDYKRL